MAYNIKEVLAVAKKQVTSNIEEYIKYLQVMGNNYKYNYINQMSIYKIDPKATACAEYKAWEQKYHRNVIRGSRGTPVYKKGGEVVYVFDISKTVGTKEQELWKFSGKDFKTNFLEEKLEEKMEKVEGDFSKEMQSFIKKSVKIAVNSRLDIPEKIEFSKEEKAIYHSFQKDLGSFFSIAELISKTSKEILKEIREKDQEKALTKSQQASYNKQRSRT